MEPLRKTSAVAIKLDDRVSSSLFQKSGFRKFLRYMKRMTRFRHMDFEYASSQMVNMFFAPRKLYKAIHYQQEAKRQWAQDDPAILVLISGCLLVCSITSSIVNKSSFTGFLYHAAWTIFVEFVLVAFVASVIMWFISNRYFLIRCFGADQTVEYGYSFDVHINSFFPLLLLVHMFEIVYYYLSPFLCLFLGNTLFFLGLVNYIYSSFLGYAALPFMRKTTSFLVYPTISVAVIYLLSLALRLSIPLIMLRPGQLVIIPYNHSKI